MFENSCCGVVERRGGERLKESVMTCNKRTVISRPLVTFEAAGWYWWGENPDFVGLRSEWQVNAGIWCRSQAGRERKGADESLGQAAPSSCPYLSPS